jgi:redox-sensitive bicupin YhaK (pirin superfamily)
VPAPPPAAAITEPAPRAPGPPPQIAQIAPRARPPVLAAPNVATGLPDGASTIDARNRDPVHLVAGDTAVDIAASKVEVTSRRGVVTMVRVFAGAAEIRHTGRRQILSAGEIWVRPETPPHATAEASLEAFATGWIALRAGHYSAAIAAFDRADDPVAAEDAAYWAAIASARAGATGDAVRRLRKFVAQFPTSSRADAARRTLARLAP